MSLFSQEVASFFHTTEQKVASFVTDIITGAEVVEADIKKGLAWVATQAPNIAAAVTQVEGMIGAIAAVTPGVGSNAAVNLAIQEANKAVSALNAFATASNTGSNDPQALLQGYVAYQTANAAAASAKAAVASVHAVGA